MAELGTTQFRIEQQGGQRRSLTLDGRGLPFAAGIEWGGEQRADVTYLPGSGDAVAQIFGPKELPMSVEGRWGDRYMGEGGDCLVVAGDGTAFTSALDAAQYADLIRREGILLRVSYASEVRYGILMEFRYRPFAEGRTLERIDWSMRFEWISRGNKLAVPSVPARVGAQNFAARLAVLQQQVEAAAQGLQDKSTDILGELQAPLAKLRGVTQSAAQAASALTQQAASAAGIAQQVMGLAGELAAAAYGVADGAVSTATSTAAGLQAAASTTANIGQNQLDTATGNTPPTAQVVVLPPSGPGQLQLDAGIGAELALAATQEDLLELCRRIFDLADQIQAVAQAALVDVQPYVVYAVRGEDLRDIAKRELGSAAAWRDIAMINGLPGSEVEPGLPLLVPRQRIQPG